MRNFNGNFLYESCGSGGKGTKMKNGCFSAECKCSPPVVNVHHYQCPLTKTPCPLHGYPFVYNLKNKKTPPDQCLVISFHPSLKTDKLFEPVKAFLNQTCEPDTKISFQYYSPRLSETYDEEFKDRQVQASPEDFKKMANSFFVEKSKTFFSDKTNKMKKLKQCFNSPCNSVVDKSPSCTAIKEKLDRIFREGTGDGHPEKSKLEKRIKGACCMKSDLSSHFLYKRDFDQSDGEKSSKEKIDPDFIRNVNNTNLLDRNVFEIGSRKGFKERVSTHMKPHFVYPSFVSPDPIKEKVQSQTQTEDVSDVEKNNEGPQNTDIHQDELKEDKEEDIKAVPGESHSGNISSDSSSSVFFTPFIFVPGGSDKEVEDKEIQTVNKEPEMSNQWVQTTESFQESVNNKNLTKSSEILVGKENSMKTTETQTSGIFMPEACICRNSNMKEQEKSVKANASVQTSHQRLSSVETLPKVKEKSVEAIEPVSVGTQTQEKPITSTVIYYEPEMKFLRREEYSKNETKGVDTEHTRSVGVQTEETTENEEESKNVEAKKETKAVGSQTQEIPSIIYYEPEMKFLSRAKSVKEGKEVKSTGVQTESISEPVTVIYFEPQKKFLKRKDENGKRAVLFNEKTQIKEIESDKRDKSVGTEPETLEESEREREKYLPMSQDKETKANSDSDTSRSYFDGSDSSNTTYVLKSYVNEESEQVIVKNWNKSRSDGDMVEKKKCDCLARSDQVSRPPCQCADTNPNDLTFVYHSKKQTYTSPNPHDLKKAQQPKPESVTKKNEDNNASLADLSDLIRIIDENFKKMFDRRIGICECHQTKERKPTTDKEVMTDTSRVNDTGFNLKMAAKSMANAQTQACSPILEEMPQTSNPDQEPTASICKVCSKVISKKTVSVGTNSSGGSFIQTKMETYCEDFPVDNVQKPSSSKPKSTETPSTSKGFGGIKNVRMSTKTFVTKLERPPESNKKPTPTPRRSVTYPEPFSDSTTSLQRNLRRAQQECGVKPKSSRITPPTRPRPTPKPRQTQLSQSRPQVETRVIPDSYCGNIVATTTTRRVPSAQVQERCFFELPSTVCEIVKDACPPPQRPKPGSCFQTTQANSQRCNEPDPKQDRTTYHVTLTPLWSKDIMKMFQRKLKKISKSESSDSLSDSNGKQKRNHDGGCDGGPIGKKAKSTESENTNPGEHEKTDCFDFESSQIDLIFKFLTKGENKIVLAEESPLLSKASGFVWVPSFPTPQFFSIRQISSAEETAKSTETPKEVSRKHSHVLSRILQENNYDNSSTKNPRHQNLDCSIEKNLIKKLFKCSSCKSLTYIQLKKGDITEKNENNSTNFKSNVEDCFTNLVFTPQSHSLVETDKQTPPIGSEHVETVHSTETNLPSSSTDQAHKYFHEIYSKFLSEKSDSNFEIDSNQVETCDNSELALSDSGKAFNISRSNKFSFHDSSSDVSNSKMATKSECFRTYRFCAESSTAISDSKKTVLKNFPSKIFQGSKRKSK